MGTGRWIPSLGGPAVTLAIRNIQRDDGGHVNCRIRYVMGAASVRVNNAPGLPVILEGRRSRPGVTAGPAWQPRLTQVSWAMPRLLATILLALLSTVAHAQSRDAWIRRCQGQDPDLANSNGYRVCTELYVVELEHQQKQLVADVIAMFEREKGEDLDPVAAREHFLKSQDLWRGYAQEHCSVAQAMFGAGNPSGDTIPSCSAGEFEARNHQLRRMLRGEYER